LGPLVRLEEGAINVLSVESDSAWMEAADQVV